ncbi:MAG TPA: FGGY-family carbohydrate kinase [Bacillota bacterium]|nr:FGGY-family carbohydrate kinase [Bacillota bacterium]
MIFDAQGRLVARAKVPYEPYFSPEPGRAEQDPEVYWDSLGRACGELRERHPAAFGEIGGLAVTTQRNSLVNVDADGRPLRPAILWLDQRKAERRTFPDPLTRLAHRVVGMSEAVAIAQKDAKTNWIRQNQPEIWAATHKLLLISGFLNHRLTGSFTDSVASQIGYLPFDYRRRRWASLRDFKSAIFPVERDKLPELVESGQTLGRVTRSAAQASGLPEGLPVIAAGSDKGCETLGTGCLDTTAASLSFGTTATVQTTSRRYAEPIRFMPAYPAPMPGYFNLEVQVFRGYWMINWFRQEFGLRESVLAEKEGVAPEEVLNRLLRQIPPGSMGLVLQPFWGTGLKTPEAKGAVIGFGGVHNRAHLYRAIIEGLGYALLDGLGKIEQCAGRRVDRLFVAGGGSQSDDICQITADLFDRPVYRGETPEAAGLGAAIACAVGLEIHPGFPEATAAMVRHTSEFQPEAARAAVYRQLFQRVYLRLYDTLRPLYHEIRDILNYPEKV